MNYEIANLDSCFVCTLVSIFVFINKCVAVFLNSSVGIRGSVTEGKVFPERRHGQCHAVWKKGRVPMAPLDSLHIKRSSFPPNTTGHAYVMGIADPPQDDTDKLLFDLSQVSDRIDCQFFFSF